MNRVLLALPFFPLLVLVLPLVPSCTFQPSPPVAQPSPLETPRLSPLRSPTPWLEVPSPGPGTGVVVGTVVIQDLGLPMSEVEVLLGAHIGATEEDPLFGVDPQMAPRAVTDEYGRFVLTDVPPGRYVIVLWTPSNSILVRDPETGEPMEITVEAQQVVNVGTVIEPHP